MSAARFLVERGHAVVLFERFALFHDRGSSHGRSRIVRRAYPDAFFTACMAQAYPLWAELERASGKKLVDECGLLYMGPRDATRVASVISALGELNVPHQLLDEENARRLIPTLNLDADEVAVFTPEAGWVDAAEALHATFDLAHRGGLRVDGAAPRDLDRLERSFDAVVVAPGAWIRDYVDVDVRVTLQTFSYVQYAVSGPVWIDDPTLTYGFPADELGQKIGAHTPGVEIDPDAPGRMPNPDQLHLIQEVAHRRFGIPYPVLKHTKTCLYTSTPDEDFRIGRIGRKSVFASACSGHGFKMGPWVGRILADIAEGKDDPENHPRFRWPRPESATIGT